MSSSIIKDLYDKIVLTLKNLGGRGQSSIDPALLEPIDSEPPRQPSSKKASSLNIDVFKKKNFRKKDEIPNADASSPLTFHPNDPEKIMGETTFAKEINEINAQPPTHPPKPD